MKRILTSLFVAILMASSIPAQATSYPGYVRNWWVEPAGDITFYFWDATNTNPSNGLCGSNVYRLKMSKVLFDEAFTSLVFAAKNNYKVWMEVSTCAGTINVIDQTLICTAAVGC